MNKHEPFIWRVNYRNESRAPETVLEIAHEKARQILQKNRGGRTMTVTRLFSVAIAAGLLLAISGTNSAARQSRRKTVVSYPIRRACQHSIPGALRPIRLARGSTSLIRTARMAIPVGGRKIGFVPDETI
jgi:hypothetical protein